MDLCDILRYLHTSSQQHVVLRVNALAAAATPHLVTEDGVAVVGGQLPPNLAQQVHMCIIHVFFVCR